MSFLSAVKRVLGGTCHVNNLKKTIQENSTKEERGNFYGLLMFSGFVYGAYRWNKSNEHQKSVRYLEWLDKHDW